MKSYQSLQRVYLTRSHIIPDPQGGGPTIYPGGHQCDLSAALASELLASGVALPVVAGEPVEPKPEPEPEPVPTEEA